MAITTHRINSGYDDTVYSFIKHEEALVRRIYSDPLGIPTLGVGYALIIGTPAGSDRPFQIRDTLISDLAAIGITWVRGGADDILLGTLLNNLNADNGLANIGTGPNQIAKAIIERDIDGNPIENSLNSAGLNEFSFSILDDTRVRQLFDISIADIRTQIQTQFRSRLTRLAATDPTITNPVAAADALFASLDGSQEMVALPSLAFTNPGKLIGPNLTAALYYGDRAEVWYNIRYDSNKGGSHANRRYREAEQFTLYNDINNVTDDDAKGAYRAFTRHAEDIRFYEGFYPPQLASDNTVQITAIQAQLEPAHSWLISNYIDLEGIGIPVDWDHIQVGEDQSTLYYKNTASDVLEGSAQNDLLLGESGMDTLKGGGGQDVLYGGDGNDVLEGGVETDYLFGGNGRDTYTYDGQGNDIIEDADGLGRIVYRAPDGTTYVLAGGLQESAGGNTYLSPDGRFRYERSGDQLLIRSTEFSGVLTVRNFTDNSLQIALAPASVTTVVQTGTGAPERIQGGSDSDLIQGNGDPGDIILGKDGNDRLFAAGVIDPAVAINTTATGTGSRGDWLTGGLGNDTVVGAAGNDILFGGGGDLDLLVGGAGDDVIAGDDDFIANSYAWTTQSLSNPFDTFFPDITIVDSSASGIGGADILYGGSGNDKLAGLLGDDYLDGGANDDWLSGGSGSDVLLGGAGSDKLTGEFFGSDRGTAFYQPGDDYLDGGAGDDTLWGEEGNDQLFGGADKDTLYGDIDGLDRALHGSDYLDGGAGDDKLFGMGGDDVLLGGADNDWLQGGDGLGNDGNDALYGEAGNDTLLGEDGNDYLSGGDDIDTLIGGAGADVLDGGKGNDIIWVQNTTDRILYRPGDGQDQIYTVLPHANPLEIDPGIGVFSLENLGLDGLQVTQTTGPDGTPWLTLAFNENDSISIQQGFLDRGQTFQFGGEELGLRDLMQYAGSVIIAATDHDDTLYGSDQADTLVADMGNDTLVGQRGNDELDGGLGNDTYIFNPGDGQDAITDYDPTASQADVLRFGAGININDLFYEHINADLVISIAGGDDQITINSWFDPEGANRIERFEFSDGSTLDTNTLPELPRYTLDNLGNRQGYGTAGTDSLRGLEGNDSLNGSDGDDNLTGGAGADRLFGEAGNDLLAGGAGNDLLYGGIGSDTYRFSRGDGQDNISETASSPDDVDVLQFGESISAGDIQATRQIDDLRLTIRGSDDWITVGNWFAVDGAKLERFEFADGTVWDQALVEALAVDGALADGYLVGTASADNLTGSDGADRIYSGAGFDVVNSGNGNDYLDGGPGLDVLNGGYGSDTYRYVRGSGVDIISSTMGAGRYRSITDEEDVIVFGQGISRADLSVRLYAQNGDSSNETVDGILALSLNGDDGILIEVGHLYFPYDPVTGYSDTAHLYSPVSCLVFADGSEVTVEDVLPREGGGIIVYQDPALPYFGTDGADTISGGHFIYEHLYGYAGDDRIDGGGGIDWIEGGAGADLLAGGSGPSHIDGDDGDDVIAGGPSDYNPDYSLGGFGARKPGIPAFDELYGGAGSDTFVFNQGDGYDRITDGYLTKPADEIDTLSFGRGIRPEDIFGYTNAYGTIFLTIGGTDDRINIGTNANSNPSDLARWRVYLGRVQFIDESGARVFDLPGVLRSLATSLLAADEAHSVPLFTDTTAEYELTGLVEAAGGEAARSYALTDRLFPYGENITVSNSGNVVQGGPGNDYFTITAPNNVISGGGGNDTFYIARRPVVSPAPGRSSGATVLGGGGNDTYIYDAGVYGGIPQIYSIHDFAGIAAGNVLRFTGVGSSNLSLGIGSLKITVGETGDEIHLSNFDPTDVYGPHAIDTFEFDDGTTLSYTELIARGFDLGGTDGDDVIAGTNTTDRITGGRGDDALNGGAGDDTYYYTLGDGSDTITDSAGHDNLVFGPDIGPNSLSTENPGNDLLVHVGNDTLTILNWFLGPDYRIENVQFADGSSYDAAWLESLSHHAPEIISPIPNQAVDEDNPFSLALSDAFTDADLARGDRLSYSASLAGGTTLPGWLDFNPATGMLTGLADNSAVGSYDITVTVTDSDGQDVSDTFTLTVNNVNDAPVLTNAIPDQTATEGAAFNYALPGDTFRDDDAIHGDTLSYTAILTDGAAFPAWLGFDASAQAFTGTVSTDSILAGTDGDDVLADTDTGISGTWDIKITATDTSGVSAEGSFTLTLQGVASNDTLQGGKGNDVLNGGGGDDTYIYNQGDGLDQIADYAGRDTVAFGPGFSFTNTVIRTEGGVAHLRFLDSDGNEGGEGVDIALNPDGSSPIETFAFADGSTYTLDDLLIRSLTHYGTTKADAIVTGRHDDTIYAGNGTDTVYAGSGHDTLYGDNGNDSLYGEGGNDRLFGGNGDDLLAGGAGNDALEGGHGHNTLIGGKGDDTILLSQGENTIRFDFGDGRDTLTTEGTEAEDNDLEFGAGITPDKLWFERAANDLRISVLGTNDGLTLEGWYTNKHRPIEEIETANGYELEDKKIELLVQAMAAFSPLPGSGNVLPTEMPEQLQPVLAAAWEGHG